MKIAIIGTGISGLGAAYLLHKLHDVTVYEKNSYIGGHSRTIDVDLGGRKTPLDTGFIVFNNWNYPNLMGLFTHLGVAYEKTTPASHQEFPPYRGFPLIDGDVNTARG